MGKQFIGHLLVQLLIVVTVGAMAGFIALVLMGGIGGAAIGIAPNFTFGLVANVVCPEGTLDYYSVQRSYHEPGESEPHLECVSKAGQRKNVLLQAVGAVLGLTFVMVFVITFLPMWVVLAVVGWVVTRGIMGALGKREAERWR